MADEAERLTGKPLCRAYIVGGPVGAQFVRRWSAATRARWGVWRQETTTVAALLYETAADMLGTEVT